MWGEALVIEWDDFVMTQEDFYLDCGFPSFELSTEDDQPLDADLFTHAYDWDIFSHTLTVHTDQMSKVGTHMVKVNAFNEGYPENKVSKTFPIIIDMSACQTITGTPSSLEDISYTISRSAVETPSFADF